MRIILVVSGDSENREAMRNLLPERYTVIDCGEDINCLFWLRDIPKGLVLLDVDWPGAESWLQQAWEFCPEQVYIGTGLNNERARKLADFLYDYVPSNLEAWQLEKTLERAWERINLPEAQPDRPASSWKEGFAYPESSSQQQYLASGYPSRPWAKVLSDFSRALCTRPNREKFLELVMDAVGELVPAAKISLLLLEKRTGHYRVAAQRGLEPAIQERLSFAANQGIMAWLAETGRILHLAGPAWDRKKELAPGLFQEMQLLQASVSVPVVVHGRLTGALCLGSKIAGTSYYDKELELLYTVCGSVAVALHDIELQGTLYNQKIYIESILQLMNSGVVAIDRNHTIITYNPRAGTILDREPEKMIGRDLRSLPSPLGDLLYETLVRGIAYHNKEVKLSYSETPVELSSYQMTTDRGEILGSVMIFDDITQRKKAEIERQQSEQLQTLHSFVSQLAHEIKNPMVAIQTFTQMLPSKYDDITFRNSFFQTFKQEVKRLDELVEQLIAHVAPIPYRYENVGLYELIEGALALLHEQGIGLDTSVNKEYTGPSKLIVKADRASMIRALSYVFKFFYQAQGSGGGLYLKVSSRVVAEEDRMANILIFDGVTRVSREELQTLFDPPLTGSDSFTSPGLSVSKKIIEDHGGKLQAAQPAESSLKFGISLPVIQNTQQEGRVGRANGA